MDSLHPKAPYSIPNGFLFQYQYLHVKKILLFEMQPQRTQSFRREEESVCPSVHPPQPALHTLASLKEALASLLEALSKLWEALPTLLRPQPASARSEQVTGRPYPTPGMPLRGSNRTVGGLSHAMLE